LEGGAVSLASHDQRTHVPIQGDSGVRKPGTDGQSISVIDVERHSLVATVDFGRPVRPRRATFAAKNGLLYVTTN